MSAKAVLVAHIAELHRRPPPARATHDELAVWHAAQHQRFRLNHFHAGVNLFGERPKGWRTGEDAVPREGSVPDLAARLDAALVAGNVVLVAALRLALAERWAAVAAAAKTAGLRRQYAERAALYRQLARGES